MGADALGDVNLLDDAPVDQYDEDDWEADDDVDDWDADEDEVDGDR